MCIYICIMYFYMNILKIYLYIYTNITFVYIEIMQLKWGKAEKIEHVHNSFYTGNRWELKDDD